MLSKMGLQSKIEKKLRPVGPRTHGRTDVRTEHFAPIRKKEEEGKGK